MKQDKSIGNMSKIKEELERRLIVMRYSKVSIGHSMRVLRWVEDYLKGYGQSDYTKEWGQKFLAEYMLQENHAASMFRTARTLVRRLDEIQENKMFIPFSTQNLCLFAVFLRNCRVSRKPCAPSGARGFCFLALAQKSSQINTGFGLRMVLHPVFERHNGNALNALLIGGKSIFKA